MAKNRAKTAPPKQNRKLKPKGVKKKATGYSKVKKGRMAY